MSLRDKDGKLTKMLKGKHFDITQRETLPDAGQQFAKLVRRMDKLEKRVRTLEVQVQKAFAEYLTNRARRSNEQV